MNWKVAIVILIVILVVFIVGVATGAFPKGNTDLKNPPDWVKSMQGFIHPTPLAKKDVSTSDSSCMSGGSLVIQIGRTCTYKISSSSETVRRLKLTSGSAHVVLTNGDKALPGSDVGSGDDVDVYGAGGKLQITCVSPISACVLVPSS